MRVLLTEDEPVLAGLLLELLLSEGYEVSLVPDLEGVGELIHTSDWDAWVVDPSCTGVTEPERDCIAALRRLAWAVPTVVTTGHPWARRTQPADLGVRAILNKPYDLNELLQTLESIRTN